MRKRILLGVALLIGLGVWWLVSAVQKVQLAAARTQAV